MTGGSALRHITIIAGNVTISFAVLSYAGTLTVMIIADPRHHPDLDALTAKLQEELDNLAARGNALTHLGSSPEGPRERPAVDGER